MFRITRNYFEYKIYSELCMVLGLRPKWCKCSAVLFPIKYGTVLCPECSEEQSSNKPSEVLYKNVIDFLLLFLNIAFCYNLSIILICKSKSIINKSWTSYIFQNWYDYQYICVQVIDFLKKKDFVQHALRHIGTSAITDLVLRLMTCVENGEIKTGILEVKLMI